MRGLTALCLGLVLVLGAGASWAGISEGDCGVCECLDDGSRPFCVQDMGFPPADCDEACGSANVNLFSASATQCSDVPGCPQFLAKLRVPTVSPYGMTALLVALGGIGIWRVRRGRGGTGK